MEVFRFLLISVGVVDACTSEKVFNTVYSREDFLLVVFSIMLVCTLPNLLIFAKHPEIFKLKQLYNSEILN